jgi:outer membrane protein
MIIFVRRILMSVELESESRRSFPPLPHLVVLLKPLGYGLLLPIMIASILFALPAPSSAQNREQPLSLERAIDTALKNQPTIAAARYAVRANEARVGSAQSTYYPQLTGSSTYTKTSPSAGGRVVIPTGTGGVTSGGSSATSSGSNESYGASVGLTQSILDFGKASSQVRISRLNTQSARFDLSNTQEAVVLNVKQAYYNTLQALRNREVVKRAVDQFQSHLDQARGFFEVGTRAKFDVTKAEVDLSNARVTLINAENQVKLNYVTLRNAMGVPDTPDSPLEDNLVYSKYPLSFEEAVQKAYAQRPDLQSVAKRREASKESINLAKKGFFPVLNGNAQYIYGGSQFPLNDNWSYGLNLSVPIFSGFLTKSQVAEAEANYRAASANEDSLRLDIYSQVNQSYLSLRAAEERISAAELGVRQAKENVDLATGRYEAGVGGPLEVTDAIVAQGNADVAYTAALTDYKNAQAALEKAIGEKP